MKTKSISKTVSAEGAASFTSTSIKTICVLLLVLFSLIPSTTKAQTLAVVSGTGMSVCASFSFAIGYNYTLAPMNYSVESYSCSGGANKESVAFSPQGNGWRVEKSNWSFIPNTTCTVITLDGFDGTGNPITTVNMSPNDVLLPCCYVAGTPNVMQFTLNGSTLPGTYNRNNWSIYVN
jgi:hypothetical protein